MAGTALSVDFFIVLPALIYARVVGDKKRLSLKNASLARTEGPQKTIPQQNPSDPRRETWDDRNVRKPDK
ncbi:MAG: hypothetical protein DME45_09335 [Verrucomicrobia bacterium]|nr:MAG: hypothetical protein DME45_09335 [Verrucomicrobiota bacterium]